MKSTKLGPKGACYRTRPCPHALIISNDWVGQKKSKELENFNELSVFPVFGTLGGSEYRNNGNDFVGLIDIEMDHVWESVDRGGSGAAISNGDG